MPDNIPKFKKICADNQKSKLKLLKILYGSQFEYADLVDFLFAIQKNIRGKNTFLHLLGQCTFDLFWH